MKRRPEFACPLFALTLLMFTLGSLHSHVVLAQEAEGRSFIRVLDAAGHLSPTSPPRTS